ncbi:protein canopy 4-like [Ciona intestinalis]
MSRFVILVVCGIVCTLCGRLQADDYLLEEPTSCEVCKYFVNELQDRLDETGKSKEILRTGHGLDPKKRKKIAYKTSELRLVDAMEGICERILQYNVHKERKGSLRFAKGRSETIETLQGLVAKGVKVDLGIPYDLWDEPSVEVTLMKKQCERMLEEYEDTIEDWYFNKQSSKDLLSYLCKENVLNKTNQACLAEQWTGKEKKYDDTDDDAVVESKKKRKGKKKKKKAPKSESSDAKAANKDEL